MEKGSYILIIYDIFRGGVEMEKEHLNVLFVQVDQWSHCFTGYGGCSEIMTPTIDQLARDGVIFSNCYSTCPVCIPARRSLMTGMFPKSHGDRVYSDKMYMPDACTMAEAFSEAGYQTVAVGKLHVYPQRSRIGFNEVILQEEGRYEFGMMDDYQTWLGEHGFVGMEFMHAMGNNTYYTRTWPLPEYTHPTAWTTKQMVQQIIRRDPLKPLFLYLSYQFPHPPLVPVSAYMDMYKERELSLPVGDDWSDDSFIMKEMQASAVNYTDKEIDLAKRAYFAQCTYIDHQLRLVIGALRENGLLDKTLIVFTSDHGEMLFDHKMVGKRSFYENSAHIPLILSGHPIASMRGENIDKLACLEDVMPTILRFCGIDVPNTVEGIDLLHENREFLYGEISEGSKATRMIRSDKYKLIYYPYGNVTQLFDLEKDPKEIHNLSRDEAYKEIKSKLEMFLIQSLYGEDKTWIRNNKLCGVEAPEYKEKPDYGFSNQRGLHWPRAIQNNLEG